MRIVAGKYRGRKLREPKDYNIRPTTDFTREALFAILQNRVPDATVLDLFGGTGALALEALSRGAKYAVIADKERTSIELIRSNVQLLGAQEQTEIVWGDYETVCRRLQGRVFRLILLDPPYAMSIDGVLQTIRAQGLCDEDTMVIYEHDSGTTVDEADGFVIADRRRYGRVSLTFLRLCR